MRSVLFVCEGNICRSPTAQAIFASGAQNLVVRSAGLGALVGMPADPTSVRLLDERGLDIRAHRATQLNRTMCTEADLVLVMDLEQRRRIELMYPQVRGRVFRVCENADRDVPDPYRKPEQAFRDALLYIDEGVGHWLDRIQRL